MSNIRETNGDMNNIGYGARAGVILDYEFNNNFYFQPGVFFSMSGCNVPPTYTYNYGILTGATPAVTTIMYGAMVPLNFIYKVGLGRGKYFMGGGPYIAYAFAGTNQFGRYFVSGPSYIEAHNEAIKFGSDSASYNPLDLGLDINLGYEWESGFILRAAYSYGLTTLRKVNGSTEGNTCISVSIGWLINNDRY